MIRVAALIFGGILLTVREIPSDYFACPDGNEWIVDGVLLTFGLFCVVWAACGK